MAVRGSVKRRSVDHENHIARLFNGIRSRSSGGADNDSGDVRARYDLIECKMTGGPGEKKRKPKLVRDFEKITEEAYMEGRDPVVALRYFDADSPLADPEGWIDFTVRRAHEDADRTRELEEARGR